MNLIAVSASYLKARAFNTSLTVLLLAIGIAMITLLMLASTQLAERMTRDAQGIDLVVGARGSPMQIVLSSICQLDTPTGNIPWSQAQELAKHEGVARALPLAMGDHHRGFRIVGTTHEYVAHYGGALRSGRLWSAPLEAVLGSEVAARSGLVEGATFTAAHGLAGESGHVHGEQPYRVVGVLRASGTVIDRLILTDVASVWAVHAAQNRAENVSGSVDAMPDEEHELTALLIQYSSAGAAAALPRYVNANSALQAASPAHETARLFTIFGAGVDVLRGLATVLILSAGLSVFIALHRTLEDRRYDLAIMRALGAPPRRLMALLLFEGLLLALLGALVGLLLGHLSAQLLGAALTRANLPELTGWVWQPAELWLVALAVAVGVLAALLPAWRASRADIAATLARG